MKTLCHIHYSASPKYQRCYMIQLCLAEKDKAGIQRCFPLQNREYGIANTLGAKRGFEAETLYWIQGDVFLRLELKPDLVFLINLKTALFLFSS